MATTINIDPLIDSLGGASATGATGTIVAVAMYQGKPATRVDGALVTLPEPVTLSFTDGEEKAPLVLDGLPEGHYWKLTITINDNHQIFYFTVPGTGSVDFGDLTFIDPVEYTSFTPAPKEAAYTVSGGCVTGTQPTFTGSPLFSGHYVRNGDLAYFDVQVAMTNITGFGTGQYFVTLPFPSKYETTFRAGSLYDASSGYEYHITGHVEAESNSMHLFTTDVQGNTIRDYAFTYAEPITLATADKFHISGTYILEEGN